MEIVRDYSYTSDVFTVILPRATTRAKLFDAAAVIIYKRLLEAYQGIGRGNPGRHRGHNRVEESGHVLCSLEEEFRYSFEKSYSQTTGPRRVRRIVRV